MKTYKQKSPFFPECSDRYDDVYVLETLEDWDEYEALLKSKGENFLIYNPNFYAFKDEFKQYIGKIWQDKNQLRYTCNGVPVYVEYKVIAIEDDNAMLDWYWVVQNVDDDRDIKYVNVNCVEYDWITE